LTLSLCGKDYLLPYLQRDLERDKNNFEDQGFISFIVR
jgi:hypothetical protein